MIAFGHTAHFRDGGAPPPVRQALRTLLQARLLIDSFSSEIESGTVGPFTEWDNGRIQLSPLGRADAEAALDAIHEGAGKCRRLWGDFTAHDEEGDQDLVGRIERALLALAAGVSGALAGGPGASGEALQALAELADEKYRALALET